MQHAINGINDIMFCFESFPFEVNNDKQRLKRRRRTVKSSQMLETRANRTYIVGTSTQNVLFYSTHTVHFQVIPTHAAYAIISLSKVGLALYVF